MPAANRKKCERKKTGGGPPPPKYTPAEELALANNEGIQGVCALTLVLAAPNRDLSYRVCISEFVLNNWDASTYL